jgi:hypothetical protein
MCMLNMLKMNTAHQNHNYLQEQGSGTYQNPFALYVFVKGDAEPHHFCPALAPTINLNAVPAPPPSALQYKLAAISNFQKTSRKVAILPYKWLKT